MLVKYSVYDDSHPTYRYDNTNILQNARYNQTDTSNFLNPTLHLPPSASLHGPLSTLEKLIHQNHPIHIVLKAHI